MERINPNVSDIQKLMIAVISVQEKMKSKQGGDSSVVHYFLET